MWPAGDQMAGWSCRWDSTEEGEEGQAHCPGAWAKLLEVTFQLALGVSQKKVWGKGSRRGRGKI